MRILALVFLCALSVTGQSALAAQYSCTASPSPTKPNGTQPQMATGTGASLDDAKQSALTSCQISFGVNANCKVERCNGVM